MRPTEDDAPPCAQDADEVAGNAFYCATKDVIAWDAEGLLPDLQSKFGDFVIPIVLAHEWGHTSRRARTSPPALSHPNCRQTASPAAELSTPPTLGPLPPTARSSTPPSRGSCNCVTPGTSKVEPNAHGSGFDRVSAFQDGFDNGNKKCKAYRDDDPVVVELPFNDEEDAARGGDADYAAIVNGVPYDLERCWSQVYPELTDGLVRGFGEGPKAVRPFRSSRLRWRRHVRIRAVLLHPRRLRRLGQRRHHAGDLPAGR